MYALPRNFLPVLPSQGPPTPLLLGKVLRTLSAWQTKRQERIQQGLPDLQFYFLRVSQGSPEILSAPLLADLPAPEVQEARDLQASSHSLGGQGKASDLLQRLWEDPEAEGLWVVWYLPKAQGTQAASKEEAYLHPQPDDEGLVLEKKRRVSNRVGTG